jgi:hypothetical protein
MLVLEGKLWVSWEFGDQELVKETAKNLALNFVFLVALVIRRT